MPTKTQHDGCPHEERDSFVLLLTHNQFVAVWWLIASFHVCDCGFLVATTWLYQWLLHDDRASFNFLDCLHFDVSYHTLGIMTYGFAVIAGCQAMFVMRMVYLTVKNQRLVLAFGNSLSYPPTAPKTRSLTNIKAPATAPRRSWYFGRERRAPTDRTGCWSSSLRLVVKGGASLVNKHLRPVLFIRGKHFDDYFLVHEWLEVVFQCYQANRLSTFVATKWINNVVVLMIVVNCISTPLIHRMMPESKIARRRLVMVVTGTFLSFISSVVVPLIIFSKYLQAYDRVLHVFPKEKVFDDVWYEKALRENQHLFVTSWADYLTTLWPHYSLSNCLMICHTMLRYPHKCHSNGPGPRIKATSVVPSSMEPVNWKKSLSKGKQRRGHTWWFRFMFRNGLWIAGVVVLGTHIAAQGFVEVDGCHLPSHPWFRHGNYSCAVMTVNCHSRGILGHDQQIHDVLSQLDSKTTVSLIFTHCPELEIPPVLQDFHDLNHLEIYNSTLANWSASSSFTQQSFPIASSIHFVKTNLSSIPAGLLNESLPASVTELMFYETNLSSLPDEILDMWSHVRTLVLEFSHFEVFPSVVSGLEQLELLSLTGNPLVQVSSWDLMFVNSTFEILLSNTPLCGFDLYLVPMEPRVDASSDGSDTTDSNSSHDLEQASQGRESSNSESSVPVQAIDSSLVQDRSFSVADDAGADVEASSTIDDDQAFSLDEDDLHSGSGSEPIVLKSFFELEFASLELEFTQIARVPASVRSWYSMAIKHHQQVRHSLYGSPFCSQQQVDQRLKQYQNQVCAHNHGTASGLYPIEWVAPNRPL